MSPQLCFQFCLGKGALRQVMLGAVGECFCSEAARGLDLFGLLGSECRCGASALNRQALLVAPDSFHLMGLGLCCLAASPCKQEEPRGVRERGGGFGVLREF